jgi:hypothetical protein
MRRLAQVIVALSAPGLLGALAGAEEDDPLAKEIRAATQKACVALAKAVTPPPAGGPLPREVTWSLNPQVRPLVALALLRAGGAEQKKTARRLLDDWWKDCVERGGDTSNYEIALAISAHEGLTVERIEDPHPTTVTRYEAKPIEADVKERLGILARTLVAGRHPSADGKGCAWSYDVAAWQREATAEKKPRKTGERKPDKPAPPAAGRDFDNSNTQFSVLALHDAARGGVEIPADVVKAVAQHFLGVATREKTGAGGRESVHWGYGAKGSQASMTFAGLSSLGIARDLGYKDDAVDKTIQDALPGIAALADRIPPPGGTGCYGFGPSYDLYSLEKALDTLDVKELDGKDWFAPLAHKVLKVQGADGLWGSGDLVDSSFFVLFLTRATVSKARLVDGRTTGLAGGDPLGEVFLPRTKTTVDAIALLRAYAEAKDALPAKAAAEEALLALQQEGHGRDACLLGALAACIRKGGDRKDTATRWVREICGEPVKLEDLDGWDGTVRRLAKEHDRQALRTALGEKAPVPVRAWAASELAKLQCADAAADVIAATESLAIEVVLDTPAGARCARAFADSLTGLTSSVLPALPPKGGVSQADLKAVAEAARDKARRALDEKIEKAFAAYEKKSEDWPKLKAEVSGKRALQRMVEKKNFRLLRAVTGELIPDEAEAWKKFLE